MPHYRTKPVIIEAYQYVNGSANTISAWFDSFKFYNYFWTRDGYINIRTSEGVMVRAGLGDWIVRGRNGKFYSFSSDIFAETFEEVEGPNG